MFCDNEIFQSATKIKKWIEKGGGGRNGWFGGWGLRWSGHSPAALHHCCSPRYISSVSPKHSHTHLHHYVSLTPSQTNTHTQQMHPISTHTRIHLYSITRALDPQSILTAPRPLPDTCRWLIPKSVPHNPSAIKTITTHHKSWFIFT